MLLANPISPFLMMFEKSEMASVLVLGSFDGLDLNKFVTEKILDTWYAFKNVSIGDYQFSCVDIMISEEYIRYVFLTKNQGFFNEPLEYFGVEGHVFEKYPFINVNTGLEHRQFRRKFSKFSILDKITTVSVLISDIYGCKITLFALR